MKHTNLYLITSLIVLFMHAKVPSPGERVWNIVAETQPTILTIESKACKLSDLIDEGFVGTFTLLDVALELACTIESQVEEINSQLDTIQTDFTSVNDAIASTLDKVCTVESKTDELDTTVSNLEGCFGIAIRQEDIGSSGLTLTTTGVYFLAEHINYAPSGTGTAAITISGDDITLDLNGYTIVQTNSMSSTVGIEVTSGNDNTQIKNGTIRNTTAQPILVNSSNTCVTITHINTKLNDTQNGIQFNSSCRGLTLDWVTTVSADNNGVLFTSSSEISVFNCLFAGNGNPTEGAGIRFFECEEIVMSDCIINDNTKNGIEYFSTTTARQAEFRNLTIFDHPNVGISLDNIQDVLITNCYATNNGLDGARLTDCRRIKFIKNFFDNNGRYNIQLKHGTSGTRNCYLFDNCLMLAGTANLFEDNMSGPNTVLGNYALGASFADNYDIDGTTVVTTSTFAQTGAFPVTPPVSWRNMSVETT